MKEYWKKYNEKLEKLSASMVEHNNESEFNFVENNFYNHIRDLSALSIAMIQSSKESNTSLKILDYGSNMTSWTNMTRKIDTKLIDVTIYDPFKDKESKKIDVGFRVNIVKNFDDLNGVVFDLVIFGSCMQYDKNILSRLNSIKDHFGKCILVTHTPLSLGETFVSKQFSDYTGDQIVHSFEDVSKSFKDLGYCLIFKSTLPQEGASVEIKDLNKTVYANLLFTK